MLYRSLGRDAVAFSALPGQTLYVFDRLAGLPRLAPSSSMDATSHRGPVDAMFADLYPSFQERGIDSRVCTAAADAL